MDHALGPIFMLVIEIVIVLAPSWSRLRLRITITSMISITITNHDYDCEHDQGELHPFLFSFLDVGGAGSWQERAKDGANPGGGGDHPCLMPRDRGTICRRAGGW